MCVPYCTKKSWTEVLVAILRSTECYLPLPSLPWTRHCGSASPRRCRIGHPPLSTYFFQLRSSAYLGHILPSFNIKKAFAAQYKAKLEGQLAYPNPFYPLELSLKTTPPFTLALKNSPILLTMLLTTIRPR